MHWVVVQWYIKVSVLFPCSASHTTMIAALSSIPVVMYAMHPKFVCDFYQLTCLSGLMQE